MYLYIQATALEVHEPLFVNNFVELLFKEEYMAIRSWPSKFNRSDKPEMPDQIATFLKAYKIRHVQGKMDGKEFYNQ